jgi:hypothetical protein
MGVHVVRLKVNRNRYIIAALVILSLLATMMLFGCRGKTNVTTTPVRKYEIVKVTEIIDSKGAKWEIYQIRLQLEGDAIFTVDLNLTDGDKVDCWYKLEKSPSGGSIDFQVKAGGEVIYTSAVTGANGIGSTSDRFGFTAAQAYGTSYRLIFHNKLTGKDSRETIFTEIIYPANASEEDSIFIPLETN